MVDVADIQTLPPASISCPQRQTVAPVDADRYEIFVSGRHEDLEHFAQEWFSLDLANGDATETTVKQYIYHFNKWLDWCAENVLNPGTVTEEDVTKYRRYLVETEWVKTRWKKTPAGRVKEETVVTGYSKQTIQIKLVAMRRFYHSAHKKGFIPYNPVLDVKAPQGSPGQDSSEKLLKEAD